MTFPISPENVTRVQLRNGIVVLVKENHSNASVSVRGRLRAGAMFETDATGGLAQFTAASLQRGTRRYTFQKLNELYDSLGMSLSVSAGTESAGFGGKALTEDFGRLLEVIQQVLLHPKFPEREIEKLRSQLVTGLREAEQDTRWVAYKKFRELAFPKTHPFHRTSDGTETTVKRITRSKLIDFHKAFYRPVGAILVIVGDVKAAQAIERVEEYLGGWSGASLAPFEIADAPAQRQAAREDIPLSGKMQSDIVIGYRGIRRKDPDFYALRMADLIFGQLGLYGRLGESVRDKMGLAYYVYSGLDAGIGAGPWTIGAGVNPRNVDLAIEAISGEMRSLRANGISEEELAHGQDFLTGSLALRLETNDGVAATLADIELYDLGLDYVERYADIFRSLTRDHIHAVIRKYADVENAVTVVAGPGLNKES